MRLKRYINFAINHPIKEFRSFALSKNDLSCQAGKRLKKRPQQFDLVFIQSFKNSYAIHNSLNLSNMITRQAISLPVAKVTS